MGMILEIGNQVGLLGLRYHVFRKGLVKWVKSGGFEGGVCFKVELGWV